jgi:hypothetical protein
MFGQKAQEHMQVQDTLRMQGNASLVFAQVPSPLCYALQAASKRNALRTERVAN